MWIKSFICSYAFLTVMSIKLKHPIFPRWWTFEHCRTVTVNFVSQSASRRQLLPCDKNGGSFNAPSDSGCYNKSRFYSDPVWQNNFREGRSGVAFECVETRYVYVFLFGNAVFWWYVHARQHCWAVKWRHALHIFSAHYVFMLCFKSIIVGYIIVSYIYILL